MFFGVIPLSISIKGRFLIYLIEMERRKKKKKTVLITGATGGLGGCLALGLHEKGYNVALNYLRNRKEAERLLSLMKSDAVALRADVGSLDEVEEMAEAVQKKWGGLDALINNAAITRDALAVKLAPAHWDDVMRINLNGAFNTIRAFSGLMIKGGGGHIINICSYSGLKGKRGQAAYSASKAALIGLTVGAAAELARYNIRVNAVVPGYMEAGMGVRAGQAMEEARRESLLNRLSQPEEAASFISALLGLDGVTGQVFSLESRIV